jgi:proteasome lid subunit RPN8/RPN11
MVVRSICALAGQVVRVTEYVLPHREFRRLHGRAYRAQQRGHYEVCGVLIVRRRQPTQLALGFLRNHIDKPGSFGLLRSEVAAERAAARRAGRRVIGIFHSHPVWWPRLGPRDRRSTATNMLHLVHDVCGVETKLWRLVRRGQRRHVVEVPLVVHKSPSRRAR